MKKIIAAIVAIVVIAGCRTSKDADDIGRSWIYHGRDCYTKIVEIDGHKYVLLDGFKMGTIIHAASCGCSK